MSPVQSTDTKLNFTSAAKRIKGYLEDTEAGILWKTRWWLTVRILQLYCLFNDFDFLFMLICKQSFLQPHFLDTTVIALQKPLQCNHSTYTTCCVDGGMYSQEVGQLPTHDLLLP